MVAHGQTQPAIAAPVVDREALVALSFAAKDVNASCVHTNSPTQTGTLPAPARGSQRCQTNKLVTLQVYGNRRLNLCKACTQGELEAHLSVFDRLEVRNSAPGARDAVGDPLKGLDEGLPRRLDVLLELGQLVIELTDDVQDSRLDMLCFDLVPQWEEVVLHQLSESEYKQSTETLLKSFRRH